MADFKFTTFVNPSTETWRVFIYETTTPNTAVSFQDIPAPHTTSYNLTFNNLNKRAHVIRIFEWLTGDVRGNLIGGPIQVYPVEETVQQEKLLELNVPIDIAVNQDTFTGSAFPQHNNLVAGQDYYIERRGTGALIASEFQNVTPFGFRLLNGALFNEGETFIIHFYAKLVTIPANQSVGTGGGWADIVDVTGDVNLGTSNFNKIHNINCTTDDAPIINLDVTNNVTDLTRYKFINHKGLQYNAVIQAPSGVQIVYINDPDATTLNKVILGKGESVELMKKESKYYVTSFDGNFREVGTMSFGYAEALNKVYAQGQLVSRKKFARIWDFVLANLSIGNGLTTEVDLASNPLLKAFFTDGDGVDTFRMPDFRNEFIRGITTDTSIGLFQEDMFKEHDHPDGTVRGQSTIGQGSGNTVARTGLPTNQQEKTGKAGGTETRPRNISLIPLLNI